MRILPGQRFFLPFIRVFPFIILLCSFLISCSDSTEPEPPQSSNTVSSEIGPSGGTLALTASDGTACRLTIPAGGLSGTTTIRITAVSSSSGSLLGALSKDFLLEPEGLEFDQPVAIHFTITSSPSADRAPAILHKGSDHQGILLETQVDGLTLGATLDHFSLASPVAPTAQDLELYWDTVLLEIDSFGVSVDLVQTLVSIYLHAQAHTAVYGSIDLPAWNIELWAQTNDLLIKGSLLCSGGDPAEGAYILGAVLNISSIMLFTDLEAEAQQALSNCPVAGSIVIDQNPDILAGAGWSLSGPRNEAGSGDMTLTDMPVGSYTLNWVAVTGYFEPSSSMQTLAEGETITFTGTYTPDPGGNQSLVLVRISDATGIAEIIEGDFAIARAYWGTDPEGGNNGIYPGDTGWRGGYRDHGNYTFKFVVRPNPSRPSFPRGNFEVKVDGTVIFSMRLETQDQHAILEHTETFSF